MRKELFLVFMVFLIGSMSVVYAGASSSTEVTFTVNPNNGSNDSAFNGQVGSLEAGDIDKDWIYFIWENTNESGFSHNLIFLDRILIGETSDEFFNVTGLSEDTQYEISVLPISDNDEEGIGSVITERTLSFNDDDGEELGNDYDNEDDDKTTIKRVVKEKIMSEYTFVSGNDVITLSASSSDKDNDPIILFLLILGFLIIVLLFLIIVVLNRR